MRIHHFDLDSLFCGSSDADESPLEPGIFLIPAHATSLAPPEPGEGERVRWTGEAWSIEPLPLPPPEPEPTPEEIETSRMEDIMAQIALQESRQPRALREYALASTALEKEECRARLRLIDSEIENLRTELCA